jgi:Z1 domain
VIDIRLPKYDATRSMIKNMKEEGDTWETIEEKYDGLKGFKVINQEIDKNAWVSMIRELKTEYNKSENIEKIDTDTRIVSKGEDNESYIPTDERSSWQLYKKKLLDGGWREDAVEKLEKSTIGILKKLNNNTVETGPVKGLVIGQVQSGKTASMAGLMAMAADWGWNTFIVLSGMIENLRDQTQKRLIEDLNDPGNNNWRSLQKLSKNSPVGERTQELHFHEGESHRYLNVCLKNKTRIENLIAWLKNDSKKLSQMKILVIDDEADQASVNTKKIDEEERAKINQLIIDLVNIDRPKSMNYISYTATPYSNLLNESTTHSLYPRDFIAVLPVSDEYFGAKQIFGLEDSDDYNGLDIVREISKCDLDSMHNLQDSISGIIPASLIDSICWFFCSTASLRYYGYKKPVSMLVHTSQKQVHHSQVAMEISNWISKITEDELIGLCKQLFSKEENKFNIEEFISSYKDYPIPEKGLNGYPDFKLLVPFIKELKRDISHIQMDEEGDLEYHKGIHLCIDNSAKTGVTDDNLHIRLAYPTKNKLKKLNTAPAFIIVGGSTLSRGLTIEGLVSTYFLRATTAADSLMQMARWFGYRKGYELFPRIWMTKETYDKFCFLTTLEEELRSELEEFSIGNKNPIDVGPRIKNTPKVSWLRVTAKNKMQNAQEIDMDFTGASIQTIHFENNQEMLQRNIELTENFLKNDCGEPERSLSKNAIVYEGVNFEKLKNEFLLKMVFNKRSRTFNQMDLFCSWFEKVKDEIEFTDWNVIVAGSGDIGIHPSKDSSKWSLGKYSVGKVKRSAKYSSMNYSKDIVNIGVLRGPHDVFADIKDEGFHQNKNSISVSNKDIKEVRSKFGLGNTPQMIIYRIDKDSTARGPKNNENQTRVDLKFSEDIIGVYISVPGDSTSSPHAKGLSVVLESSDIDAE